MPRSIPQSFMWGKVRMMHAYYAVCASGSPVRLNPTRRFDLATKAVEAAEASGDGSVVYRVLRGSDGSELAHELITGDDLPVTLYNVGRGRREGGR